MKKHKKRALYVVENSGDASKEPHYTKIYGNPNYVMVGAASQQFSGGMMVNNDSSTKAMIQYERQKI